MERGKVYGGTGTEQDMKFALYLRGAGFSKMSVIAVVKDMKGISLTEAKAIVDSLPQLLAENLTEEQAIEDRRLLENVGAVVDLLYQNEK